MIELLALYSWTILAGTVAAGALSLLGCHLAARDKAMQTLCVGQGATLGVLIGIGFLQSLDLPHPEEFLHEGIFHLCPFVTAALCSLGTFQLSEALVRHRDASKSTIFLSLFAILLALGYLTTALFPGLENHMAQVFFGDIATLSNADAILTTVLFAIILGTLILRWRPITNESFETATFGNLRAPNAGWTRPLVFHLAALVSLCFSVQYLGFLFTIACLFIPTALLRFHHERPLRTHFAWCVAAASVSSFLGFCVSLSASRLPTVPAIVAILVSGLLVLLGIDKLRHRMLRGDASR